MNKKDLVDLYVWIRQNNNHTPDEVVDFMYQSALESLNNENKLLSISKIINNIGDSVTKIAKIKDILSRRKV